MKLKLSAENKNSIIYLSASVISAALGIIFLKFFTVYLNGSDYSIFGFVSSVNLFLIPFYSLNLNTFFIKKYYDITDELDRSKLLSTLVWGTLMWSLILTIFLISLGGQLFSWLQIKQNFFPYMYYMLLCNLTIGLSTYLLLIYRIKSSAIKYFLFSLFQSILVLAISYYFVAYLKEGISGRIYGVFIASLIIGITALILLMKHINFSFEKKYIIEGLKFALPLLPYSIVLLLFDFLDRLFIERFDMSNTLLGTYTVASQFSLGINMLSIAILRAYEPELFSVLQSKSIKSFNSTFMKLVFFVFVSTLLFIVISPIFIGFLTNHRFENIEIVSSILVASMLSKFIFQISSIVLISQSKNLINMYLYVIALIFLVILSILFVPVSPLLNMALVKYSIFLLLMFMSFYFTKKYFTKKSIVISTLYSLLLILASIISYRYGE